MDVPLKSTVQTPTNAKDLLTILGMISYLNRYSAKLAQLISPLRDLIKKNALFKWEELHQIALNSVISCYDPNPGTVTVLQCDASQEAWIRHIDSDNNKKDHRNALTNTHRR